MTQEVIVNALIRAVRTFVQTFIGLYLAGLVASPTLVDLANPQLLGVAAAGGIVALLSFVQNVVEEIGPFTYRRG